MYLFQEKTTQDFTSILSKLSISIYKFDINQCEERTFYITIRFWYANHFIFGELIYLLDREEFFGALSLNNSYTDVQRFFEEHFDYTLLHTDEIHIARLVAATPKFQEYIQQYKCKFPTYKLNLFQLARVSVHN
ncbi:hypothetical protein [Solibacillus sp. FSL K6-1523]|uniref:hypothetical protein n=1 Tax=Solibacillus sp. FSL K6-1523 TaxID=2921471 RepID=UPI0030F87A38